MSKLKVKTTENCHHEWLQVGSNELGTWWNCTHCDTTGLNKEEELQKLCIKSHEKKKGK
jgi:hypothetical protein